MSWVKNNEWLAKPATNRVYWSYLARFLNCFQQFKGRITLAVLLAILSSVTAFLVPPIFRTIQTSLALRNTRMLIAMLAAFMAVLLWQALINYFINTQQAYVSTETNTDLLLQYYRKLLNISLEDFIAFRRRSNLFQRVMDAMAVTSEFTGVVIQGLRSAIVALVLMIAIGWISLLALSIVAAGTIVLFLIVFTNGEGLRAKRQAFLAVNYPLVERMFEAIEGLFTIKALAASISVTSDIGGLVSKRAEAERAEYIAQAAITQVSGAIGSCILASTLGASFILVMQQKLDYSGAFSLYVLVGFLLAPVAELAKAYQSLSALSANVRNYYQIVDIPDEWNNQAVSVGMEVKRNAAQAGSAATANSSYPVSDATNGGSNIRVCAASKQFEGHVAFHDVVFSYRDAEPIFDGLNLEIQPGERVSLIGRSGVGKTTLLRLAMGFLKPQSGVIRVDGTDISRISDLNLLRRSFGLVSQQDFFFGTTIRENLTFGLDGGCSDLELIEVLNQVDMRECLEALPDKLQTVYSSHLFSGGQKQRLFIARALLRKPKIVLLDEPTSALDFENEARVIRAIETLASGRTTITVAHRLSTVRSATKVLVLKDRRIIAAGTHAELYATSDYYKSFCDYNSFIL